MTHRVVIKSAQKEIDGMQFELTARLPYLTIVAPDRSRVLYKCVASTKRSPDGAQIYEHTGNVGLQA
jgi:hypothetical protein